MQYLNNSPVCSGEWELETYVRLLPTEFRCYFYSPQCSSHCNHNWICCTDWWHLAHSLGQCHHLLSYSIWPQGQGSGSVCIHGKALFAVLSRKITDLLSFRAVLGPSLRKQMPWCVSPKQFIWLLDLQLSIIRGLIITGWSSSCTAHGSMVLKVLVVPLSRR